MRAAVKKIKKNEFKRIRGPEKKFKLNFLSSPNSGEGSVSFDTSRRIIPVCPYALRYIIYGNLPFVFLFESGLVPL